MIFNEAAVQKSIENFSDFVTSGKLDRQERDYKKKLIRVLGAALSDEAIASPDFIARLSDALKQIYPAIANLTHFIVAADFRKYVTVVSIDRLRSMLTNLFDENVELAKRFDAFDVELNADYDSLIEKGKRSNWLTSLLLTVRFPEHCTFYRTALVKFAQNAWDCDVNDTGTRGQRYVAYIEMVELVRQRLSAAWQRPADLIDAHSFLWIAKAQFQKQESWRESMVQWFATHPKTIPDDMSRLRAEFVAKFPREKSGEMTLEQYAPGQESKDNFCYWLEFKTAQLGRIGVGSAYNFGVYWSQKEQRWQFASAYKDEHEAIRRIRSGLEALVKATEEGRYNELDKIGKERLGGFLGLRCKPLYLYFPEELLPISQPEHLQEFLRKFGAQPEGEVLALNRQLLLLLRSFPEFEGIDTYQIGEFLYQGIGLDESSQSGVQRVWKIAPGPDAQYWDMCRDRACIAVGWLDQTDFREFPDRKSVEEALEHAGQKPAPAGQIMRFTHRIKKGDIVIANKGIGQVVGIGKVVSDYIAPTDLENPSNHHEYRHARLIDWVITEPLNLGERVFPQHTVSKITPETWERIRQGYIAQDPKLKDAFVRLTGSETPVEEPEEVIIDEQRYSADIGPLVHLAEHTKNFILYGPPGTGKTFLVRKFAGEYLRAQFTPEESVSTFCTFVTFHQSFAYEEFVEGLRPVASDQGAVSYKVLPGVFRKICALAETAWDKHKEAAPKYILVIDEINRANIAKVFGELITLLEDDKRLGKDNNLRVRLPYSGDSFGVPPNLFVIGTMNTADRSIALLDLALRRRFAFHEVEPDPSLLDVVAGVNLQELLSLLNKRIELLRDRDHRIGHSYFMEVDDEKKLHFTWFNRVLPLLQEYFYNENQRLYALLGDQFVEREPPAHVPAEMEDLVDSESPRFRVRSLSVSELPAALLTWINKAS